MPAGSRARTIDRMTTDTYDVAVIGGGAAGLSAALVLGRARRKVAVIDAGTPRNAAATHLQGFISRDGMAPDELLARGREEVIGYGVDVVEDRVTAIDLGFVIRRAGGAAIQARTVLIATGAADQLPDIPGVRERWGRDFLHCPYCHGWEVQDAPIGVIGSPGYAHLLRQWSGDVIYFADDQPPTDEQAAALRGRGIDVVSDRITRLVIADDRLDGVELEDGRVIARDAVFMQPVLRPHGDGLLDALGCDVDELGFPIADPTGRTSVPHVWIAGNAANPRAQVVTAAGEGSAAAIAINADLVVEDLEREIA